MVSELAQTTDSTAPEVQLWKWRDAHKGGFPSTFLKSRNILSFNFEWMCKTFYFEELSAEIQLGIKKHHNFGQIDLQPFDWKDGVSNETLRRILLKDSVVIPWKLMLHSNC